MTISTASLDLVSIIIPCYNNDSFVAQAIDSALAQTYPNIEIVIVDDGSTDNSPSIVDEYRDRATVTHQANAGACVARNNGLARSKGEWIKFLDADDLLKPDCIMSQITKHSGREIVIFGDCELIDEVGRVTPHPTHAVTSDLSSGDYANLRTFLSSPVLTSTTLFPRSALNRTGAFNPSVQRGQEHELHLRLFLNGVDFEYHPQICYQYRQHQSPTRLSVSRHRRSHFNSFENFEFLVRMIENGPRRADVDFNRKVLGQSAWRTGRRLLRYGEHDHADLFFAEAVRLGGQEAISGTEYYKFSVKHGNPYLAERISKLINQAVSLIRSTNSLIRGFAR